MGLISQAWEHAEYEYACLTAEHKALLDNLFPEAWKIRNNPDALNALLLPVKATVACAIRLFITANELEINAEGRYEHARSVDDERDYV
jgi:hypothetical protein